MRQFKTVCAQGDIYIKKIEKLPSDAVLVQPENGRFIVTHSETGHHHVMVADRAKMFTLPDSIMDVFLQIEEDGATLEHMRPHDTHETIAFNKGTYHVRRQREYVSKSFRRVED